ncbi:MAG: phospholipase D-like domain-containing protein [Nanoarchaeota archaeon]
MLFLIINGCDNNITGNIAQEDINENDVKISAYFCPRHDCEAEIIEKINNAEKTVHCAFYDLNLNDLISAITKKSSSADVRVIIDTENYDGQIKGNNIKIAKTNAKMHNKFCVIDGNIVLTGSTNPTNNDAHKNNNNLIMINSDYIAENYEDEFNELWDGIYSNGNNVKYNKIHTPIGQIENYFCPEDCALENNEGLYRIIELIRNAESSVKIASFSFTHEELADELLKADIKGINISVLVEARQRNVQNSQYARLKDFGLNIRIDGNKNNMHNKFIVIDNKIVVTGSPNFSFSGFNRNDENMLIIFNKELALGFVKEFDRLFEEGETI